jgi:acetyltransferase-like isoleucine patch superfamily enzyme
VSIGDSTTFQTVYLLCQEGCDITVGRHCMFSREIEVRTTDAHSLVDISSGTRLNRPQSIVIGDHVWVGLRALINKGASIPDDSIVGAAAFVNSAHSESHTVLAGVPAKVVRRGVTWNRGRKDSFTEEELLEWR